MNVENDGGRFMLHNHVTTGSGNGNGGGSFEQKTLKQLDRIELGLQRLSQSVEQVNAFQGCDINSSIDGSRYNFQAFSNNGTREASAFLGKVEQ